MKIGQKFNPEKYDMIFCPDCGGSGKSFIYSKGNSVCKVCGGFGLIRKEEANVQGNWAIAQLPKESRTMEKFKILIVDDDSLYRRTLMRSLQESFPTIGIDEAADGGEAMRKVNAFLPNLIFMDIRLPGENGLELTKKIKATHPNITILVLTCYDTPDYREFAFQYGADHFLAKTGLDHAELEELVKSYLKV